MLGKAEVSSRDQNRDDGGVLYPQFPKSPSSDVPAEELLADAGSALDRIANAAEAQAATIERDRQELTARWSMELGQTQGKLDRTSAHTEQLDARQREIQGDLGAQEHQLGQLEDDQVDLREDLSTHTAELHRLGADLQRRLDRVEHAQELREDEAADHQAAAVAALEYAATLQRSGWSPWKWAALTVAVLAAVALVFWLVRELRRSLAATPVYNDQRVFNYDQRAHLEPVRVHTVDPTFAASAAASSAARAAIDAGMDRLTAALPGLPAAVVHQGLDADTVGAMLDDHRRDLLHDVNTVVSENAAWLLRTLPRPTTLVQPVVRTHTREVVPRVVEVPVPYPVEVPVAMPRPPPPPRTPRVVHKTTIVEKQPIIVHVPSPKVEAPVRSAVADKQRDAYLAAKEAAR